MSSSYIEKTNLSDVKEQYSNKLKVLCTGKNFDVSEKEKFDLLNFMSREKNFSGDIIIENEVPVQSGIILVFPNNPKYKELVSKYQNNHRYYQSQAGEVIQDKVKIIWVSIWN